LEQIDCLKTVPKGLYAAYHTVIDRIDRAKFAMRIITWIYRSPRILEMDELLEALVVGEYSENANGDEELDEILEYMVTPNDIVIACKGLVLYEESSGSVRFSHETVKGFIASELEQKLTPPVGLAKTCLIYLGSNVMDSPCPDKQSLQQRMETYKFSRYASQYWAEHIRGDKMCEKEIQSLFIDTFGLSGKRDSMVQVKIYAESRWGYFIRSPVWSLLHVVAESGLTTICRRLLNGDNCTYAHSFVCG